MNKTKIAMLIKNVINGRGEEYKNWLILVYGHTYINKKGINKQVVSYYDYRVKPNDIDWAVYCDSPEIQEVTNYCLSVFTIEDYLDYNDNIFIRNCNTRHVMAGIDKILERKQSFENVYYKIDKETSNQMKSINYYLESGNNCISNTNGMNKDFFITDNKSMFKVPEKLFKYVKPVQESHNMYKFDITEYVNKLEIEHKINYVEFYYFVGGNQEDSKQRVQYRCFDFNGQRYYYNRYYFDMLDTLYDRHNLEYKISYDKSRTNQKTYNILIYKEDSLIAVIMPLNKVTYISKKKDIPKEKLGNAYEEYLHNMSKHSKLYQVGGKYLSEIDMDYYIDNKVELNKISYMLDEINDRFDEYNSLLFKINYKCEKYFLTPEIEFARLNPSNDWKKDIEILDELKTIYDFDTIKDLSNHMEMVKSIVLDWRIFLQHIRDMINLQRQISFKFKQVSMRYTYFQLKSLIDDSTYSFQSGMIFRHINELSVGLSIPEYFKLKQCQLEEIVKFLDKIIELSDIITKNMSYRKYTGNLTCDSSFDDLFKKHPLSKPNSIDKFDIIINDWKCQTKELREVFINQ